MKNLRERLHKKRKKQLVCANVCMIVAWFYVSVNQPWY